MKKYLLFLLLCLTIAPVASAQDIQVGLYLLNLGKFDISTGSFTADFYLSFLCEQECPPIDFEFMNGRATSSDLMVDKPNEKFYRIQANLISPVDLRRFPFDSQKMEIIMEDKVNTRDIVTFAPFMKQTGMDDSISFIGWNIKNWTAEERAHEYQMYNEVFSQYQFTVNTSRIVWNAFFKTFLPVLIIVLIVMFSFIMDPDKIIHRMTITTSSLVAAVMFHISITNQIPPVGYLTIADKFMILTYLLLLASVILNVLIMEYLEQKDKKAYTLHRRTEYSVFIIVPLLYILFFLIM